MMTAPLSDDLRSRVVRAIEGGLSRRQAASKLDVSVASAVRWHQRWRRQGSVVPDPIGGNRSGSRAEVHAPMILGWIDEDKDITIPEINSRLREQGYQFANSTIWRLLERHNYTRKKRLRTPASKSVQM